jgi:hypothetical protein
MVEEIKTVVFWVMILWLSTFQRILTPEKLVSYPRNHNLGTGPLSDGKLRYDL